MNTKGKKQKNAFPCLYDHMYDETLQREDLLLNSLTIVKIKRDNDKARGSSLPFCLAGTNLAPTSSAHVIFITSPKTEKSSRIFFLNTARQPTSLPRGQYLLNKLYSLLSSWHEHFNKKKVRDHWPRDQAQGCFISFWNY